MPECDLIVIGGSAGGLPALTDVLRSLPQDLPAAVLIVIHTAPDNPGVLPALLDRAGPLPACHAVDGEPIRPGRVYVAPPDRHLLVDDDHHLRLWRGPKENGFRPAVDPLFRSAARSCGERVAGVILSGGLDDGTYGLMQIKRRGGVAIAQDPGQAIIPAMPASAIANVPVDRVAPSGQIASLLVELLHRPRPRPRTGAAKAAARQPPKEVSRMPKRHAKDPIAVGKDLPQAQDRVGPPSVFSCPDCGGVLWEIDDGNLARFRCHVGHEYTADGLMNGQGEAIEYALWSAVRALEEHAALRRRMAQRMRDRNLSSFESDYTRQAVQSEGRAALIRDLLLNGKQSTEAEARLDRQRKAAQRRGGKVRRRKGRAATGGD